MALDVAVPLTLCFLTYCPCLVAFSFGFYVLLNPSPDFQGYVRPLLRVLSMMVDEMNYDTFDYNNVAEIGGRNISVQLMFVIFAIFMSLIIMNLLIAVSVNKADPESLLERSKLMITKRTIKFLDQVKDTWDFVDRITLKCGPGVKKIFGFTSLKFKV